MPVATLLFCLPALTWVATGILAGWLAARRGKSWRVGFALGFFFSTAGVVFAALPRRSGPCGAASGPHAEPPLGSPILDRTEHAYRRDTEPRGSHQGCPGGRQAARTAWRSTVFGARSAWRAVLPAVTRALGPTISDV
jgi:hypothetical protein